MNVIRRLSQLLMTACCLVALTACASDGGTQPDSRSTADAKDDILQLHAAFTKAFNAKDASGMAATYTDDAIMMSPNLPEVKTSIGIQTYAHQMFSSPTSTSILLNANETEVLGDGWAYSSGFYTLLDTSGHTLDKGKFLEVLKQTDKGWKIHRDSFNSDMPVPAAGTAMAPAAATATH